MATVVWSLLTVAATITAVAATLNPPVLPLVVRNPYLSTWLASARDPPWEHWPIFWTGQEVRQLVATPVRV